MAQTTTQFTVCSSKSLNPGSDPISSYKCLPKGAKAIALPISSVFILCLKLFQYPHGLEFVAAGAANTERQALFSCNSGVLNINFVTSQ